MDQRFSTALIAARDTLVALLLSAPLVLLLLFFVLSRYGAQYPGVGVFERIVAYTVPVDSIDDPRAVEALQQMRAAEGFRDVPVWLYAAGDEILLMTPARAGSSGMAREALAGTLVNTSRVRFYQGTYSLLMSEAIDSFERDPGDLLRAAQMYVPGLLAASGLGFLIAGWWFRRQRPVPGWEASGAAKPALGPAAALGVGVGVAGLVLSAVVGGATRGLLGVEDIEQPMMTALAGSGGVVLLSFVVFGTIVAPLGEELFFRGHLFRWSASRCGNAYAYTLTAVVFALIHGNPPGIPSYVALAVVLGWAYERWRTLAVPIVAHATINAVGITLLILR